MGRSTETDICDHVARIGEMPVSSWFLYYDLEDEDWRYGDLQAGWCCALSAAEAGRSFRLFADCFVLEVEGKLYGVFSVNEHEYAAGGGMSFTIFGISEEELREIAPANLEVVAGREAVEFFLKYFGLDVEISDIEAVQQTL